MEQTLCDVCEQPIEGSAFDRRACLRLDNGGMSIYGPSATVTLHIHWACWERIRGQFLSERLRQDKEAARLRQRRHKTSIGWRIFDWLTGVRKGE